MASFLTISKTLPLIFIQFLFFKTAIADFQPKYFYTICDDNGNYTQNSLYQTNLKQLLTILTTQADSTPGFYNTSIGEIPDKIYGIYYCRADITPQLCRDCIAAAAKMILTNCTTQKEAVVWYEECTLRYANRAIYGLDEDDMRYAWWFSKGNVSNPIQFNKVFSKTIDKLIKKAAYNTTYNGYATEETSLPPFQTLYSLVQCSHDILGLPCERCLRRIYNDLQFCCNRGRIWMMTFRTNCQMRYDTVPFYAPLSPPPNPSPPPPPPPLASKLSSSGKGVMFYITRVVIPTAGFILVLLSIFAIYVFKWKNQNTPKENMPPPPPPLIGSNDSRNDQPKSKESLQYSLDTIKWATMNFSDENRLGEGGFGAVYKGRLEDGQQVAVKRLSEDSRQGHKEFSTEVQLVANLQHRNLVKLLGFCLEGEEKLLVYEFVPNLSLDRFLFDPIKRRYLDWETRFKIIIGISRGLMYLHEDSRLKIVHRDLKASNILLDEEMNPKIADFGLARLMKLDHTQANTSKIFGTFGYMAPEYATAGVFSSKSDVYSLGVIILEIISGQSNNLFGQSLGRDSLISYARRLWNTGTILELVDPSLGNNFSRTEVLRCIQVGLFCVQEEPSNRPTMDSVLLILHNSSSDVQFLPRPSQRPSHTNVQTQDPTGEGYHENLESISSTEYFNTDLYPQAR